MESKAPREAGQNKPFFMYLAFRAPHAPYSHNLTDTEIQDFLPWAITGKPGEQIGLLDNYVGQIMAKLEELKVADNTLVIFTSDNGPDESGFHMFNTMGHIRTTMLRGKKASSKSDLKEVHSFSLLNKINIISKKQKNCETIQEAIIEYLKPIYYLRS